MELGSLVLIAIKLERKPMNVPDKKGKSDFLYLEDNIET